MTGFRGTFGLKPIFAVGLILFVVSAATFPWWRPFVVELASRAGLMHNDEGSHLDREHAADDHAGHSHDDPHTSSDILELTSQAMRNLGLTDESLLKVSLSTYRRSITVPAVVVPKPGRTRILVASPLNGVVTHVHAVTGEAVLANHLLFAIRLTYEDLVETQTAYLRTLSELEVENREITRLEQATRSGAVSGKSLLERRYAKEKLEAFLRSQREALKLHGLSDRQVDAIGSDGRLLRDLQIVAPDIDRHDAEELRLSLNTMRPVSYSHSLTPFGTEKPLVVEDLQVSKGQAVVSGEKLCALSDFSQLFIEGKAFDQDITAVTRALEQGWSVEAAFPIENGADREPDLKFAYVSNSIDEESRTLSFFVELPNTIVRDVHSGDSQRFISWKYRVGQRLELRVPVEQWENQMVVPIEAIAKDGPDWFVFRQQGKQFQRVPVHILYRDSVSAVIANDGALRPGFVIAGKSAYQMQMAIRNNSGGGVDPHAGHNH